MSYAKQLLDLKPLSSDVEAGTLAAAIDALNDCAQACIADAHCWRPVPPVARAAATNANGMPCCTSTAGSAPGHAAAPSKHAGNY